MDFGTELLIGVGITALILVIIKISVVIKHLALDSAPPKIKNIIQRIKSSKDKLSLGDLDELGILMVANGIDAKGKKASIYFIDKDYTICKCNNDITLSKKYATFTIDNAINTTSVYTPSDIRYTSVTVGNVTTGGFSDHGNYYTTQYEKTGKKHVICRIGSVKISITSIKLNTELVEKTDGEDIFDMLAEIDDYEYAMLYDGLSSPSVKKNREYMNMGARSGNAKVYEFFQNKALEELYLTKEDASYLAKWFTDHLPSASKENIRQKGQKTSLILSLFLIIPSIIVLNIFYKKIEYLMLLIFVLIITILRIVSWIKNSKRK